MTIDYAKYVFFSNLVQIILPKMFDKNPHPMSDAAFMTANYDLKAGKALWKYTGRNATVTEEKIDRQEPAMNRLLQTGF